MSKKNFLIPIDSIVHLEFKTYCAKNNCYMGAIVEKIIIDFLEDKKQTTLQEQKEID